MNRLVTLLLLLLVAAVAVFLFVFEPRLTSTRVAEATRDKVLNLDPLGVTGLRIASGNNGFELVRREDGWWVGPKPRDLASPKKVMELLEAAANLRVFDVIRADQMGGRDLGDFGLKKPKSQLELQGENGATLYFGKEAAGDGRMYVRRSDAKDVYVVSDDLQALAFRNPEDFRDRRLSNLPADRITWLTIKRGAWEITLERGGHGWEIVRPLRARADDAAVEKLLQDLLALQIADFVADESDDLSAYGLGDPRAEVIFSVEGESRPMALRIGADTPGKTVLAQFTARDSVYHLPARALELAQVQPDALRDRRVAELNLDTVDAIRFAHGATEKLVERSGDGWKSDGRELSDDEVLQRARMLTDARVLEYLPLTDENLRRSGLDRPAGRVSFDAWLSENTPETTAGRRPVLVLTLGRQETDKAYLRVNDDPEICVVPTVQTDVFK